MVIGLLSLTDLKVIKKPHVSSRQESSHHGLNTNDMLLAVYLQTIKCFA